MSQATPDNSSAPVPSESRSLDELAADLGPFAPTAGFSHGDEFEPAPPRPIPERLKRGSFAQRRRRDLVTLIVLAVGCFLFWPLPFVQELGYYVLAFQYLHYLGAGLLLIAAIVALMRFVDPGPFRYVRDGVPLTGRVLATGVTPLGTAEIPQFEYAVGVEWRDPDSGERQTGVVRSGLLGTLSDAPRYTLAVSPGDYVTLVAQPRRIEKTLQLYGLLGLDPDRELILKDGRPRQGFKTATAVLVVACLFSALTLLSTALYAMAFCFPIDDNWRPAVVPGAVGALLGAILAHLIVRRERRTNPSPGFGERFWLYLGIPLLGAFCGVLTLAIVNSQFDRSPPTYRPIEVEEYWQVTHTPLFVREYQIEYRELGGNETRKQPSRVEQMLRFEGSNLGVIEIGAGACGLQWVRQIHPLRWVRLDDGPAPHLRPLIAELPDGSTMRVAAVIELDDGTMIPSPEALVDFAKTRPPGFLQGLRLRDESASNEPERQ